MLGLQGVSFRSFRALGYSFVKHGLRSYPVALQLRPVPLTDGKNNIKEDHMPLT